MLRLKNNLVLESKALLAIGNAFAFVEQDSVHKYFKTGYEIAATIGKTDLAYLGATALASFWLDAENIDSTSTWLQAASSYFYPGIRRDYVNQHNSIRASYLLKIGDQNEAKDLINGLDINENWEKYLEIAALVGNERPDSAITTLNIGLNLLSSGTWNGENFISAEYEFRTGYFWYLLKLATLKKTQI